MDTYSPQTRAGRDSQAGRATQGGGDTQVGREPRPDRSGWIIALVILLGAAWTFGRYGDQEELFHDHGIILYAGQQVLEGQPPYVGIFDHKGPGAALVCAAGVAFGELVGSDDVRGVRFLFLWLSAATVAATYLLGRRLFGSGWPGWLAAAAFVGFWNFAIVAYSGPEPKTPMVLCQVLALLFAAERRWLLAGCAASLAFLVWQPMGVFCVGVVAAAWGHGRGAGSRAVLRSLVGCALPLLAVVAYYAYHGALFELADGLFLFNLGLMENEATLYNNFRAVQQAMLLSFKPAGLLLALGLFAMVPLALWRVRRFGFGRSLLRDPFACLLLTFPFPVLWSLLDFQGGPDFFVFLPYGALGFGWLAHLALQRTGDLAELDVVGRALTGGLAVATLWVGGWILMDAMGPARLGDQRRALATLATRYPDARLGTVGAPQAMVLLELENPTRYGFMMRGIANHVQARHPGGFDGWLRELESSVDVLLTTEMAALEMGAYSERWLSWLEGAYRQGAPLYGRIEVWERRAPGPR